MDEIADPLPTYDFTKLTCISPSSITGGNYFIRILRNPGQKPFYIQPPKCTTKQGIVKVGKKMVCDLLFRHEDESFTEFLEGLETYCRAQLYEHKDKWFDSELTENDIEESFTPTAKLFRSGKLHSVRVNIPIRLGKCSLKIFNEEEEDVKLESIVETTQIMTILEVQGIRCSARNFQLELEVKQMMTMNQVNLFETCVFTSPKNTLAKPIQDENEDKSKGDHEIKEDEIKEDDTIEEDFNVETKLQEDEPVSEKTDSLADSPTIFMDEVDVEIPKEKEEMKLKKRNYVYYNMYKDAKRKAKIARDFAIASYLEAKQIRNNFLDETDLSEEDEDGDELDMNVFRGFNP